LRADHWGQPLLLLPTVSITSATGRAKYDMPLSWDSLLKEIWPQERDFLARPDRWKYVRKMFPDKGCVFCTASANPKGQLSLKLYESAAAMVVMNKYPYNSGHLMVLPKRHTGNLLDLSESEFRETQDLIRLTVCILAKEYQPSGFNIGLNHGAVAGAGIPDHLHWHIIPRWAGDTNFFPLIAETKVLPETVEQSFSRLAPHFEAVK